MSLTVERQLRDGARFQLVRALMISSAGRDSLATLHSPRPGPEGPEAGPGEILDADRLARIAAALVASAGGDARYLDPRVLATGVTRTVWWQPAGVRPLHLSGAAARALPERSGKPAAHPPLVFAAEGGALRVFALSADARPTPETALMRAPYPNLYAAGRVCLGSARVPEHHGADRIQDWETGFHDSAFSHANPAGGARLVRGAGGVMGLWREMIDTAASSFPPDRLVAADATLGELIDGRIAG